jgi:ubiquinone biosynthesis protein UbiJ
MEAQFRNEALTTREKARMVGPIAGRISRTANSLGFSIDDEATKLNVRLQKMLSAYMKEISGATVPEEEVKRLAQQIPSIVDDTDNFKIKLDGLFDDAKRTASKFRQMGTGNSAPNSPQKATSKNWRDYLK